MGHKWRLNHNKIQIHHFSNNIIPQSFKLSENTFVSPHNSNPCIWHSIHSRNTQQTSEAVPLHSPNLNKYTKFISTFYGLRMNFIQQRPLNNHFFHGLSFCNEFMIRNFHLSFLILFASLSLILPSFHTKSLHISFNQNSHHNQQPIPSDH